MGKLWDYPSGPHQYSEIFLRVPSKVGRSRVGIWSKVNQSGPEIPHLDQEHILVAETVRRKIQELSGFCFIIRVNASLVWIRRGYFDLIAKFVSISQVYPYKGDGYIKLSNNCFSDYLPSLQWIKYTPEESLATSNHFLLGREYLIYVYSSNYQGGNLVYSHQPFVNLVINSPGVNKL